VAKKAWVARQKVDMRGNGSCLVDPLDLQLMRRIGVAPFLVWPHPPASIRPAALAKALGVSTDTVKRRLAAMAKAGVFHGTQVFPNPRHLGLRTASFHFRMGSARGRVPAEEVAAVPGVLGVFDMVGGDRCLDVAFADDADRRDLCDRLAKRLGVPASHFVDFPTPAPQMELTPMDWRILHALRRKPGTTTEAAARSLGLSPRTVKRRFDRMAAAGALDVIGLFDPGAMTGHLLVDLLFHFRPGSGPQDAALVVNAFRNRWVAQWTPPDRELGHLALVLVAGSARELEDLRREGESLACVERCEALVVEAAREDWGWVDAQIAARASIEATAPAAPEETPMPRVPIGRRKVAPKKAKPRAPLRRRA
jgi:DNA-binding Lrp family transcriptional regulator